MPDKLIPAAQYVRMSTEHQQYSIDNQKEVIAAWALLNGYEIVRTYEDRGKSGVTIRRRAAIRQLLADVSANPPFEAILVYDVSRWGRFMNIDEAAHYEFICSEAGVHVQYCAETFVNDGNMPSLIMKALKRVMAGEYSRDLSRRTRAGIKRLVELGYSSGGVAPYGYRRMLVSSDGEQRGLLRFGDRKGLAMDRVKFVLGPSEEVARVRLIYDLALQGKFPTEICRQLNDRGLLRNGKPWRRHQVLYIVGCPKFAGINTWSRRTSSTVRGIRKMMPIEQWIMRPDSFPAIIDPHLFEDVQRTLKDARRIPTNAELLQRMKEIFQQKGKLSASVIEEMGGYGSSRSMCYRRFRSLQEIYEKIGFSGCGDTFNGVQQRRNTIKLRDNLIQEIINVFPEHFQPLQNVNKNTRKVLLADLHLRLTLVVWSRFRKSPKRRWLVTPIVVGANDAVMVCTLDQTNSEIEGYYLLRGIEENHLRTVPETDPVFREALKLDCITELYGGLCLRFPKKMGV